jgi:hypothetical protein
MMFMMTKSQDALDMSFTQLNEMERPAMNTNSKKLHIKVLQYMHGDMEYFAWSETINRRYCERHGYDYVRRCDVPRSGRHVNWHKIPTIRSELHDCDYLLCLDADAHFYSHELTIEQELLPLLEGKPILMARDITCEKERWHPDKPNAGVILMEVHDRVRKFFDVWNRSSDMEPSTRWNWPLEQLALWYVVMPKFPDMVQVWPEYYMIHSRYGQYIRHYSLRSDNERLELMKQFCQSRNINPQSEIHVSDWHGNAVYEIR